MIVIENKLFFFKKITTYIILCSYILFWDVKYNFFNFKYSIFILLIFFLIDKKIYYSLKYPLLILFLFSLHLFFTNFFYNIPISKDSLKGLILIFFLSLFIFHFQKEILSSIDHCIKYFPIFIFITFFLSTKNSEYFINLNHKCSLLMLDNKFLKIFFEEYSHYGMIFSTIFLLNLYYLSKSPKNFYNVICFFIIIISSLLYGSTTLTVGIIFSSFVFLIFQFKNLSKFLKISLALTTISYSSLFYFKDTCLRKISDINIYFESIVDHQDDLKEYENYQLNIDTIDKDKSITLEKLQNCKINYCSKDEIELLNSETSKLETEIDKYKLQQKRLENEKLNTSFNKVNISTQVIIKSLITSYNSLLSYPLGVGINNYEYSFFKFNKTNVKESYFSRDTFFINYNDAASNFPKIISEFGYLSLVLLLLAKIFFNQRINLKYKLLIFPIIFTQLFRAAGYFNGGFIILILMCFILPPNDKKN